MADKKISALTAATTPLAGTEVLPIVQAANTVKVAVSDLTAGRAVSATSFTASTGNFIVGTTAKGVTTGSSIPLGFGVNNTVTAITIDTASNVGVGTASPSTRLHAQSSASNTAVRVTSELSGSLYFSGFEVNRAGTAGGALMRSFRNAAVGGVGWEWLTTVDNAAEVSGTYTSGMVIINTGNVGIGTTPVATALLDVQSTTKGVRFPNMTTVQKTAITPSAGTVVFDTTLAKLCVYSGAAWQTVTSI